MNTIINLNYRGNSIPLKEVDGSPWVNLNAMGRPFAKDPNQWLRSEAASEYIAAMELLEVDQTANLQSGEISPKKAISVQNGGKNPGTWAHELVALEFARWCDPSFAIWCNRQLRELLTKGEHKIDMNAESRKRKWDQTLLMVKNGQKWGQRFIDFLRECERPSETMDPRERYIDLLNRFFGAFTGKYEFKKDILHKMRANFQTYKEDFMARSKTRGVILDNVLMMEVDRELENIWARYEASSRAQMVRRLK